MIPDALDPLVEADRDHPPGLAFSYPLHCRTGSRGYFSNRESVNESWHCRKIEARSDLI